MQDAACHLFAYAIPSEEALTRIRSFGPIVEVGAGTGYWAALLRQWGTIVDAYDIHATAYALRLQAGSAWEGQDVFNSSTNASNEYHGDTPAFTVVKTGGPEKIKRHPGSTLLLCYPPPHDPMAERCLKLYKGDTLLYVGEWRGNTGTRDLEAVLLREWQLEERLSLPAWGSEANSLMVWRRRAPQGFSSASELPCRADCGKTATHRCRLCCDMAFCSQQCMERMMTEHKRHHATKLIPLDTLIWDSASFDKLSDLINLVVTQEHE